MIRSALLAAPILALSFGAAPAQPLDGGPRDITPGGAPAMQMIMCQPTQGQVVALFSQQALGPSGWTSLNLQLTASGSQPVFARVVYNSRMSWQGFLNPGQAQDVVLGNGTWRTMNDEVSAATTVTCGMAPPG